MRITATGFHAWADEAHYQQATASGDEVFSARDIGGTAARGKARLAAPLHQFLQQGGGTMRRLIGTAMLVAAGLVASACQNTREGLEKDAEQAAPKVERAVEQSAQAAREAGREVAAAAAPAAEAIKEGAAAAGQVLRQGATEMASGVDAAQQGAQIKAALMADASIDSTTIDVETDADTKTITLNGHVRTAAEKRTAESIAKSKATGYRVRNNLAVGR